MAKSVRRSAKKSPQKGAASSNARLTPASVNSTATAQGQPTSKQSRVLAMLRSPAGATVAGMMQETGWQQHSVRGFLAGVVRKRLGLDLQSNRAHGERSYRIASSGAKIKTQVASKKRRV